MEEVKIKVIKPETDKAENAPEPKKCQAAEVGHRSCDCGGPDCSFNAPKK